MAITPHSQTPGTTDSANAAITRDGLQHPADVARDSSELERASTSNESTPDVDETIDTDDVRPRGRHGLDQDQGASGEFAGQVLSPGALLAHAMHDNDVDPIQADALVRHTAAGNARRVAEMIAAGELPDTGWRFGILQTLDDYTSTLRRGGVVLAAKTFQDEPAPTGSAALDAAFAALADYLAERDGWPAPAWALDPARVVPAWYPAVPTIFRADANRESPRAFRERGIWITEHSLAQA